MSDVYRGATNNASERKILFDCHRFLFIWALMYSNVCGIYEIRSAPNVNYIIESEQQTIAYLAIKLKPF
jgi:hypothetical protein